MKLRLPKELSKDGGDLVVERVMKAGEVIYWGQEPDEEQNAEIVKQDEEGPEVLCHVAARTHRRVFLGADRHTSYYQAVDGFTCAYLLANDFRYVQTPYIFDFGTGNGKKNYNNSYPRQFAIAGQSVLHSVGPRRIGAEKFIAETGYGFLDKEGIIAIDSGGPDDLRRDLLEGSREVVFILSLPKGKYDLLLICGDEAEDSSTKIDIPGHGTQISTGRLTPGFFCCKILPVVHERDGELLIRISSEEGYKWKLNALFVNKEYGMS